MALPDTREDTAVDGENVKPSTINAIQDAIIALYNGKRKLHTKILDHLRWIGRGTGGQESTADRTVSDQWEISSPGYAGDWAMGLELEVGDRIHGITLYVHTKSGSGNLSLGLYNNERTDTTSDELGLETITAAGELYIDLTSAPITVEEDDYYTLYLTLPDENIVITYLAIDIDHP